MDEKDLKAGDPSHPPTTRYLALEASPKRRFDFICSLRLPIQDGDIAGAVLVIERIGREPE